jgi:hypothetical protein
MVSEDGSVIYETRRRGASIRGTERPRSGQYLTASSNEVIDSYGTIEAGRQTQSLFLEESGSGGLRARSRSITYATTGPRISRERVVVEEAGRRRESYRTIS